MSSSASTKQEADPRSLAVKMVTDAWKVQNSRVSKFLFEVSDDDLVREIVPGRNTGLYILGHLTAVNDGLLPLFGFGDRRFPVLEDHFIKNPDGESDGRPSPGEVRKAWAEILGELQENFEKLTNDGWFGRHTSVTEEDFQREPHRNRLTVVINRTIHTSYHLGQLLFLTNKEEN